MTLPETWPDLFRLVSTLVGTLALALLAFRLISTWRETVVLVHALGLLAVVGLIGGTLTSYQLAQLDSPHVPAGYVSFVARVGFVVLGIMWPRWLDRRHSPFRRTPTNDA